MTRMVSSCPILLWAEETKGCEDHSAAPTEPRDDGLWPSSHRIDTREPCPVWRNVPQVPRLSVETI